MRIAALVLLLAVAVAADLAPLLQIDSPVRINGSYIVILKDEMDLHTRDAHIADLKDLIAAKGDASSKIGFEYHGAGFVGFSAYLTPELLKAELAHPDVKYIECDQIFSINYKQDVRAPFALATQTGATWGIDRVDQRNLPLDGRYVYNTIAGSGVDVYVIDTGILTTHVDFGGRATSVYNAISGESGSDLNGHGTHCAGTIGGSTYGVAKQAQLKGVKVLSASGSGSNAGVIAGVNYVTNNKASSRKSVASMSLGGGVSTALDDAVAASISSGVPYAIAAGNSNANACNSSPSRVATAVTVGATDNQDNKASFSNYGTCVNMWAPGVSITSCWIGSNSATNTISGTSMACPHVAGGMALHLSQVTSETPAQTKTWLANNGTPNVVKNPGTGSTNVLLYTAPTA